MLHNSATLQLINTTEIDSGESGGDDAESDPLRSLDELPLLLVIVVVVLLIHSSSSVLPRLVSAVVRTGLIRRALLKAVIPFICISVEVVFEVM